jgi:hypothetical protein
MTTTSDSVYASRDYSSGSYMLRGLPGIFVLAFLCLVMIRFSDGKHQFAGWIGLAACAVLAILVLWPTIFRRAPLLTLTPSGLTYRAISKSVIPWRDIQAIDMREHVFRHRARRISLPNSTVIWISKSFHDRSIANQSPLARGPFQLYKLIRNGDRVGLVIPPEALSVTPPELYRAIFSRWKAFGPLAATSRASQIQLASQYPPTRDSAGWLAVKLAVPLLGIAVMLANIAGLWETQRQASARQWREKWTEQQQRDTEERRKRDESWKKMWEDFDKTMKKLE